MALRLTMWGAALFLVGKTEARIQGMMRLPSWSFTGIILETAAWKVRSEARLFGSTTRFCFFRPRLEGWGGDNGSVSEGGHRGWFQSVTLVFLFRHIFTLHFSGLVGTIFVNGHGGWGP
jgi:hypothetical protein